jgi:hypothetical protein
MGPQPKKCHNCKSDGHLIADCPTKKPDRRSKSSGKDSRNSSGGDSNRETEGTEEGTANEGSDDSHSEMDDHAGDGSHCDEDSGASSLSPDPKRDLQAERDVKPDKVDQSETATASESSGDTNKQSEKAA